MKFQVACIQTNSSDDIDANIAVVGAMVREAHGQGAKLVALPENVFCMEAPGSAARQMFTAENHPGIAATRAWAKELGVWILIGSLAVKIDESGKRVNRSLLIDDRGELICHYDKIHLFDVTLSNGEIYSESAKMLFGGKAVLAETPWGNLGLTVCYDVRFPNLYRSLAKAGADIIAVPAAFTAFTGNLHWHVLLRARAIENGCYIIAPAQAGTHPGGRQTYGHSLIVDPLGLVVAEKPDGVGVLLADIDRKHVDDARRMIPSLQHDRDFSF